MFPAQFTPGGKYQPLSLRLFGDLICLYVFASTKEQYWAKLSGPLMDRIDLQVAVNRLKPEEITRQQSGRNHLVRKRCSQLAITPIRALKQNHLCAMPRCRVVTYGSGAN